MPYFARIPHIRASIFQKIHGRDMVYSCRVTLGYRALGLLENEEITWFWIGSHADYDRLLKKL